MDLSRYYLPQDEERVELLQSLESLVFVESPNIVPQVRSRLHLISREELTPVSKLADNCGKNAN